MNKRLAIFSAAFFAIATGLPLIAQPTDQEMVTAIKVSPFPVGVVLPFAGVDTPLVRQTLYEQGWLLADGCHLDEKQFFSLWLLVRDKYGAAPAGRFRIPDLRGRIPLGAGTGGSLTQRDLGQQIGEENHALSGSELPSHTHKVTGPTSNVRETHAYYPGRALPATDGDDHSHNVDIASQGPQDVKPGAAHNVIQPSLVVNYIVFFGKHTNKMPSKVAAACTP